MNILEKSIRAIGGVFNERLRAYFKSYGATSNVLQDAEKEYLKGRGLTFGANQDAWKQLEERFGTVIPLEVSDILKKYNGTLLLPGASGVQRYGFQPGNYVESTGQTLSAADAAVGLVLDAAGSLGAETLANGGFDSPTGWVASTNVEITAGVARFTAANFGNVRQNVALVPGRAYLVTSVCSSRTSGAYSVAFFGGSALYGTTRSVVGTYSEIMIARAGNTNVRVTGMSASDTLDVASVSVVEITGVPAQQPTTQYKPLLRNASDVQSWQFDGVDDRLVTNLNPIGSTLTAPYTILFGGNTGTLVASRLALGDSARLIGFDQPSGKVFATNRGRIGVTNGPVLSIGQNFVCASRWDGTTMDLFVDAYPAASSAIAPSVTAAATGFDVGSRGEGAQFWLGRIHGASIIPGVATNADVALLLKFLASLQGRTL